MAENPLRKANQPLANSDRAHRPADATPAQKPQHLLTPLAALWPTAALPEPLRSPATAAEKEKASTQKAVKTVKVTFALHEPGAKQVFLCGEFNDWASDTMPMKRDDAGRWETTVALAPGRYEYKFVVDGTWKHDPLAHVNVWNQNATLNSVAQVRP